MNYLSLKKSSRHHQKIFALLGIVIPLNKVSLAVKRIEEFSYQKLINELGEFNHLHFFNRNKNSKYLEVIKNIYLDNSFSQINFSFLEQNKESIDSLLFDLSGIEKFNKEKLFKLLISKTFLEFSSGSFSAKLILILQDILTGSPFEKNIRSKDFFLRSFAEVSSEIISYKFIYLEERSSEKKLSQTQDAIFTESSLKEFFSSFNIAAKEDMLSLFQKMEMKIITNIDEHFKHLMSNNFNIDLIISYLKTYDRRSEGESINSKGSCETIGFVENKEERQDTIEKMYFYFNRLKEEIFLELKRNLINQMEKL